MTVSIAGNGTLTGVDSIASNLGKALQVVQAVKTDTFSTTSSSFTPVTGLSVAITPSSASNKVLLIASLNGSSADTANHSMFWRISGGNSTNFVGDAAGSRIQTIQFIRASSTFGLAGRVLAMSATYLDSPSTISAVTYEIEIRRGATSTTAWVNRSNDDTDNGDFGRAASSLIAIEVAA